MAKAKEISGIDCVTNTAAGVRLVLTSRLDEVFELRDGALGPDGHKGVHDMRVSTRRLRSALRDFLPLVRRRRLAAWGKDLKKVADALGEVRDLDVKIKALEKLCEDAPEEAAPGLARFVEGHRREREAARLRLTFAITDDALGALREEFGRALEHALGGGGGPDQDGGGPDGGAPPSSGFSEAGREIILGRWREVSKAGASLYRPFKPKPLHELRIRAKRLRYALELFAPCWGDEPLHDIAEEVSELQTSLGELHDCDVWTETLAARLCGGAKAGGGGASPPDGAGWSAEERRAAVWLMGHFSVLRAKHFRDAFARWHDWQADNFALRVKATLENAHAPSEEEAAAAPGTSVA